VAITSFNSFDIEGNKAIITEPAAEAGISLSLIRNVFEIFAPLVYTNNLKDAQQFTSYDTFGQRIRFVLNFRLLNPLNATRTQRF
jgi:hypothetical protein